MELLEPRAVFSIDTGFVLDPEQLASTVRDTEVTIEAAMPVNVQGINLALSPVGVQDGDGAAPPPCPSCGAGGCTAHVLADGRVVYAFAPARPNAVSTGAGTSLAGTIAPFNQTFKLSSLPTATKTIYLDFTGHRTIGTGWNLLENDDEILTAPFSLDANPAFSEAELTSIQQVWAIVAEDFAPFQVNVTTQEPRVTDLQYSGGGDLRWGVRVVVSDASYDNPAASVGGIAFLNSFKDAIDTPCFVNTDGSGTDPQSIAMVVSHEVGHTLGLNHHGIGGTGLPPVGPPSDPDLDYYSGHGVGQTGWGPLMGSPYGRNVTQWSRGEYAAASRPNQDDLAIISNPAGQSGFGYRPDDHRDGFVGARPLSRPVGQAVQRGTGIIERNTDADMFAFTVATGPVDLHVRPFDAVDATAFSGANLDVGAILYASDGRVIAEMRPENRLDARFTGTLTGGRYYVRVFGTGNGDPLVNGYSNYGSLGQYTVDVSQTTPAPSALPQLAISGPREVREGNVGRLTSAVFTVSLSKASAETVTVQYAAREGTATLADGDFQAASGTLSFAPGQRSKTFTVFVVGDAAGEADETFSVELTAPIGASLGSGEATVTIRNDDRYVPPPVFASIYGPAGTVAEGSAAVFTIVLSQPATTTVQVGYRTVSGTAVSGRDFRPGSGFITFSPGETVKTVSIATIDDTLRESNEQFSVQLVRRPGPVQLGSAVAAATVGDNDGGASASAAFASFSGTATGRSLVGRLPRSTFMLAAFTAIESPASRSRGANHSV